jgi:hypothetical protein
MVKPTPGYSQCAVTTANDFCVKTDRLRQKPEKKPFVTGHAYQEDH